MYATHVVTEVKPENIIYIHLHIILFVVLYVLCHIDLQIEVLKDELETANEAAQRAPSKTMKHLVERLRNQLALKEKQQKVELKCRDCAVIGLQNSSFMDTGPS